MILKTSLLLFVLAFVPFQKAGQIDTTYDRFKDRTTVETDYMRVAGSDWNSNPLEIAARFVCSGQKITQPEHVVLFFYTKTTHDWPFKTEPGLIAIADGERLNLGKTTFMDGDARFNGYDSIYFHQYLAIVVPFETFRKIKNAGTVEMQLGEREFTLNKTVLVTFRALADRAK